MKRTNKFILYHESIHLFISILIAFLIWQIYRNSVVALTAILAGVIIDIDHLFDLSLRYLKVEGPALSLRKAVRLFYTRYMDLSGKIYLPLHSLELIWIWWLLGYSLDQHFGVNGFGWALTLPILAHILVDYASYMPHPLAYFIFYRLRNKFSKNSFMGKTETN